MIATERLILRRWRDEDAAAHHAMCANPDVARYFGPSPTLDESREAVARQNEIAETYGSCFWAIERRADARFVGWCGIKPGAVDTPIADQPEIGWSLARDAWGQGLAIAAARAALAYFWTARVEAPRVYAITVPANLRSQTVMIRLGMTRLAHGDFDDLALVEGDPLRRHLTYAVDRP